MYTAEDFLKDFMIRELCDKGIDIFEDDYYRNTEFKKLESEPFLDKIVMPKSWWIEKHIVGQERLKRIYGIYALGVEHEFSDEELDKWEDDLARKYNEAKTGKEGGGRTVKDIQQYLYRKDKSEELGLVERLRKLGFDIDKFAGEKARKERVKLLYFLFGFEFEKKVKIWSFLSKPSFENIDNSIAGDKTRNGELMAYLKNNTMKEINENYIAELKAALHLIIDRWEEQIFYMTRVSNAMIDEERLDEIYADLQWTLGLVEERTVVYMDSLLETFYLKLSLHEMIGREQELINSYERSYKEGEKANEIQRKRCKEYLSEVIPVHWYGDDRYKEVLKYVKEHRKALAQCIIGKDKISGNDYRKFDKAAGSITHFLDFYRDNTEAAQINYVPVILLISHMQEYVFGNEKIDAKFYRYTSEDKLSLRAALDEKVALRRNQYAWIEKVNRRWYSNIGTGDIYRKIRKIDRCLDELLMAVYAGNSLREVKYRAWLLLSYIEAFVGKRDVVEERFNMLINFLDDMSYRLFYSDKRMFYQCINFLDGERFYSFICEMGDYITNVKEDFEYTYLYDLERDYLYPDNQLVGYLKIKISVKNKEVDVIDGGLRLKDSLS